VYPIDVLSSSFVDKVIVIIETCRVVSKLSTTKRKKSVQLCNIVFAL
jgi:hypothetical protein